MSHTMQKQSMCTQSQSLVLILNCTILMVSTNATKCDPLIMVVDILEKPIIREFAIVCMVVLDNTICLSNELLISSLGKKSLVQSKISHEMNVHKITNVITKRCTAPDTITCEKASHLGNEPRLS